MRQGLSFTGMWVRAGLAILVGLALQSACYAGKVTAHAQPGVDFSQYKTYQWLPTRILAKTGLIENDPDISPLVKAAVNHELALLGLKEVAQGGDLQVSTWVLTESIPQMEKVVFQGNVSMIYATPIATMGRYNRQGTLVVSLIDTRTKEAAWAGMVTESLDNKAGAGQKKIAPAAAKLFKKYPLAKK